MGYRHGVHTKTAGTSVATPVESGSGIVFAVGTAPVHMVDGAVNKVIFGGNYVDAAEKLGYSDDWEKYTLCEVMYSEYKLYGKTPVIFVNVLDPKKHQKNIAAKDFDVVNSKVKLPLDAIKDTLVVKNDGASITYEAGTDFETYYDNGELVVERLESGNIPSNVKKLNIAYKEVDPSAITETDIIGGYNLSTKELTGLELIKKVFPLYRVIPEFILAPKFSSKPTVAAVMSSKAEQINGIFGAYALIDVDSEAVKHYSDVPKWKLDNNIVAKNQPLYFPKLKLGDRVFHMSTQMAGLAGKVDRNNDGVPCESPSNKELKANATVLADGTEVAFDVEEANYLNGNGIMTAINFIGGFRAWGNNVACYPANTDVKDYIISISRMFTWVAKTLVLTFWSKIDKNLDRRFVETIVDTANIWLNGLMSEGKILGGRIEFRAEDNNELDLMAGKAKFRIFLTPPSPAKDIEFILEYDHNYVKQALGL